MGTNDRKLDHVRWSRRMFLTRAAAVLPTMHMGLFAAQPAIATAVEDSARPPVRFLKLRLHTHVLEEQKAFYCDRLGFPKVSETSESFSFQTGDSIVEFMQTEDDSAPFYHFAFSIAENKLPKAMDWLATHCPVLRQTSTGKQVIHFRRWNAHAIYFLDPAGNIGEFIAHHTLETATPGEFSLDDVLYTSEIGLVTPNVPAIVNSLKRELDIADIPNASPLFTPVGDAHGYFIVVKENRVWLPTDATQARVFPVEVTIQDDRVFSLEEMPYRIRTSSQASVG